MKQHPDQPDLFQAEIQPDRLEEQPERAYRPDPDKVRSRLHKILAEARSEAALEWEPSTLSLYQTALRLRSGRSSLSQVHRTCSSARARADHSSLPQMTNWLPEDEAAQLRLEFEAELKRLAA